MAIDTAAKRRSASGTQALPIPVVTPNASKPVAWRQQAAGTYSGIAPSAPEVSSVPFGSLALLGVGR